MQAFGRADSYPLTALLEKVQISELAAQARQQVILRIQGNPVADTPGLMILQMTEGREQSLLMQRQEVLAELRNHPVIGRLVIHIDQDISKWENTSADIELRAGDTLNIPKRPNFVMINGQVYDPIAVSYVPHRDLSWYLDKAGGATRNWDKKHIYVLHADGSIVVPRNSGSIWMGSGFRNIRMQPGDTIFVPEKDIGGSQVWQNIIAVVQVMSAIALPLAVGGVL